MSQAGIFGLSLLPPGTVVETLTGNTGGAVGPDGANNINVVGDGVTATVSGNAGTNTLTISVVSGPIAEEFDTDSGTAIPAAGVLNIIAGNSILHAGSSVLFTGSGNTVQLNVTDNDNNTIIGFDSGNLTISGANNTSLGAANLINLTSGDFNTAIGSNVGTGLTTGDLNILIGPGSGTLLSAGDSENTLIGDPGFAGAIEFVVIAKGANGNPILHNYPGTNASTTNGGNVFVGSSAGNFTLAGAAGDASNNGIGSGALSSLTTGARNNALGVFALSELTTGQNNIAIGHLAGDSLFAGAHNVLIGYQAGVNYIGAESSNILIGVVTGTVAESNTLRIGSATGTGVGQLSRAFIAGIDGVNVGSVARVVTEASNQLGTAVITAGAGITITPGANLITIASTGAVPLSFPTDSGTATPVAGVLNIKANTPTLNAGSSVSFSAPGATNLVQLNVSDALGNTIIGIGAGNLTISGTNNTVLGKNGATGLSSGSSNTIVGEGATSNVTTGSNNIVIGVNSGDSLAAADSQNTLVGHPGISGVASFIALSAGSGGSTFFHNYPGVNATTTNGGNIFIGRDAGNYTLNGGGGNASNDGIGEGALNLLTTGARNDAMGSFALSELTSGTDNVAIGYRSGTFLLSGTFNTILGSTSGSSYVAGESSNILINATGTAAESNVLRIGSGTGVGSQQLNKAFISGIDGINVGSTATVVTEAGNQLGTAVITAGTGITVTPGANSITISSSGLTTLSYTNVATTPYVVLITDDYISVDSSGGPITIQLPNAATLGKTYVIKDRTGSADTNAITVTTVGGIVNIDGSTTYVMDNEYQATSLIGNGSTYELY